MIHSKTAEGVGMRAPTGPESGAARRTRRAVAGGLGLCLAASALAILLGVLTGAAPAFAATHRRATAAGAGVAAGPVRGLPAGTPPRRHHPGPAAAAAALSVDPGGSHTPVADVATRAAVASDRLLRVRPHIGPRSGAGVALLGGLRTRGPPAVA